MKGDSLVLEEAMKRIRELEAELKRSREAANEAGRWLSRAEKAEARVAELERRFCICENTIDPSAPVRDSETPCPIHDEAREREVE